MLIKLSVANDLIPHVQNKSNAFDLWKRVDIKKLLSNK